MSVAEPTLFQESKPKRKVLSTGEIKALLRERYPKDAYAYMEEVPNGTGGNKSRSADALVMSLWPSRGLYLYGFEVKASRADWLNELKRPAKADAICRFCDFWFLVVGDESIVQPGELPPTWGLMYPSGGKLKVKVEAPKLEAQPITRAFLAGLFRAAQDNIMPDAERKRILDEGYKNGLTRGRESAGYAYNQLKEAVDKFERLTGVEFKTWDVDGLAEAYALVKQGGVEYHRRSLDSIKNAARRVIESIEQTEVKT